MTLDEQISCLMGLFRGLSRKIGQSSKETYQETDGKIKEVKRGFASGPVTINHWKQHLQGETSLGICPINDYDEVKFMAIDVDTDIMETSKVTLHSLVAQIDAAKLPLIACQSKSGGCHLYVFFKDSVPVVRPYRTLKNIASFLGLTDLPHRPIEFFPHTQKLDKESNGKYINLPYFNALDTVRFALHPDGHSLSLSDFLAYAQEKMVTGAEFCKWAAPQSDEEMLRSIVGNGPPCLQTIFEQGIEDGTRNDMILQYGILFKKYDPSTYQANLHLVNNLRCHNPLDSKEVDDTLKGVRRKDFFYNCSHPCMSPICAKSLCMQRKYGIRGKVEFPPVKDIIQWGKDDEYLEFVFEDDRKIRVLATAVLNFQELQAEVMRALHIVLPVPKKNDWFEFITGLMSKMRRVAISEEFSVDHSIRNLIVSYATGRAIGDKLEDLLVRKPAKIDGKILIRHKDIREEISKKIHYGYVEGQEFAVLMNILKGDVTVKEIQGEKYAIFVIPDPKIDQEKILKEIANEYEPTH